MLAAVSLPNGQLYLLQRLANVLREPPASQKKTDTQVQILGQAHRCERVHVGGQAKRKVPELARNALGRVRASGDEVYVRTYRHTVLVQYGWLGRSQKSVDQDYRYAQMKTFGLASG